MSVQGRQNPVRLVILLVLGGFCVLAFCLILAAILFPVFVQAREMARLERCMDNLKALALAQQLYANDHGDWLPIASQWGDLIRPYVKPDEYRCPSIPKGQGFGYAMNARLSRQKVSLLGLHRVSCRCSTIRPTWHGTPMILSPACPIRRATGAK
jgi:hypothetical protein